MRQPCSRPSGWIVSFLFFTASVFFLLQPFGLGQSGSQDPLAEHSSKLSNVLREEVAFLTSNPQADEEIPVIVKTGSESFEGSGQALDLIQSYSARLTGAQIQSLLDSGSVEYITLDVRISTSSSDEEVDGYGDPSPFLAAIGADQLHEQGYTGAGVTVAVFDSGISSHPDLDPSRIVASVDFTSGTPIFITGDADEYGHGTAVAGILGGTGQESNGAYAGVAPDVRFLDLKVVGDDGSGLTSNLIKAIEWVIENQDTYNVRVANLSVGHPPIESYTTDPLGQAVEALVASGIVAVASAGNLGKDEEHPVVWGAINSPANHPAAIAVYPINTRGTATHSDDIATTYGPADHHIRITSSNQTYLHQATPYRRYWHKVALSTRIMGNSRLMITISL